MYIDPLQPYRELAANMARINQMTELDALIIMKQKIERRVDNYNKELELIDKLIAEDKDGSKNKER